MFCSKCIKYVNKRQIIPLSPINVTKKVQHYGKRRVFIFPIRNACLVNTVTYFKNDSQMSDTTMNVSSRLTSHLLKWAEQVVEGLYWQNVYDNWKWMTTWQLSSGLSCLTGCTSKKLNYVYWPFKGSKKHASNVNCCICQQEAACSAAFYIHFIVRLINLLHLVRHHLNLNRTAVQMCGQY